MQVNIKIDDAFMACAMIAGGYKIKRSMAESSDVWP